MPQAGIHIPQREIPQGGEFAMPVFAPQFDGVLGVFPGRANPSYLQFVQGAVHIQVSRQPPGRHLPEQGKPL